MAEPGISLRQQVALNLADTCTFGGLNESYGVNVAKQADKSNKSYWGITFAKARILDGNIRVYSPTFILVEWQTAIRVLPNKGREVFRTEAAAKQFLTEAFINRTM